MARARRAGVADEALRVVVVGAGFAGLEAAKRLARQPVEVVLVDRNNFHTFQPLLYQVAAAGLEADDVAHPLRGTLRRHPNVSVVVATVVDVHLEGRCVSLDDGRELDYDYLVLAPGASTNTFATPGVAEHGFGMKSLQDAVLLRNHLLERFEEADRNREHVERGALDVVIVGGGPTGVELAGALRELYDAVLAHDFPRLPVRDSRVVLVEATDRLVATLHPSSSRYAASALRRKGIDVELGTRVASVGRRGVCLADGRRIPARTTVWVAGIDAPPLVRSLPVEKGAGGRVVVGPDLSPPGWPEVFVAGDAAAFAAGDRPLPQLAPYALQMGRHAARAIDHRRQGRDVPPFAPHDRGVMATIGRNQAVAELRRGIRVKGRPAWLTWLALHLVYLVGFRNRVSVLLSWGWNYLTYDRAARILVSRESGGGASRD